MPWIKVDDWLYSHPKWLATSPAARGLWVTAGSWAANHLQDGHVPRHLLSYLGGRPKDAAELVSVGLWDVDGDGWRFHDWLELQPSAEQVEGERAAARERQRRAREKSKASRRDSPVTHTEVTPVVTVPPTRPDPTRPSLGTSTSSSSATPVAREALLREAALIIGQRAAQRPSTRDPDRTADAVANAVCRDRYQDAYAWLHDHPDADAPALAEHLEPTNTPRPTVATTGPRLRPVEEILAEHPERPDDAELVANIAALKHQLHPTPEDAA